MISTIDQIAEAVTHELNTAAPSKDFTAVKRYRAKVKKQDLGTGITVQVVPSSLAKALATRADTEAEYTLQVGMQKRLDSSASDDETEIAGLMLFAEELAEIISNLELTQMPAANWVGSELDPIYDPEAVDRDRIFRSVIELTYQVDY
jgi:hypothetical protein